MTITLDLSPDVEMRLMAQAQERGLSLNEYLQEIITRAAGPSPLLSAKETTLSDLLLNSPFAGADLDLDSLPGFSTADQPRMNDYLR